MAFLHLEFPSAALGMTTGVQVILPDTGALNEASTVYLFHGLTDNCTGWTRFSSCERYARERGIVLIIPEVQRSFYTDGVYGLNYFTYVSEELPQAMQRIFGLSARREQNFVMGLSMGGYGALKCALTHPQRYAGCGSFSGVADLGAFFALADFPFPDREITALLGPDHIVPPEGDLKALLEKADDLPPIYLSCGEEDALYGMNCALSQALRDKGAIHRFDHRPGAHSWDFWDQSIQDCFSYLFG